MKISRKKIMAARKAVKAASGRGKNPVLTVPASQCETLGLDEYPNFSSSGSVSGMRKKYYGDDALLVKCGGYIYNVSGNPDLYWAIYNGEIGASTKTRKTPIKADAADVYENSDDTFEEIFYDICINDNHNGNYYEREEDAIEIANQYAADPAYADDEITVVLEHYMTNARGEIIDYFDDNGAVVWSSNDAIYDSTNITCAADANGYEDLALALGDAIKKLAADEDHLNNFLSYLTQHFPEWLRKYANTPEGLVSEFREFANMNF